MAENQQQSQTKITLWQFVGGVIIFLLGIAFSGGVHWGQGSNALDNLTNRVGEISGTLATITQKLNDDDKQNSKDIQKIVDTQLFQQQEIDEIRNQVGQRPLK